MRPTEMLRRTIWALVWLAVAIALASRAADLTPGHTFTSNERVTADTLNGLVSGATINSGFYLSRSSVTLPSASDVLLLYVPGSGYRQITVNALLYQNTDLVSALLATPSASVASNFLAQADSMTISNLLNRAADGARSNFVGGFWSWGPLITNLPASTAPQQSDLVLMTKGTGTNRVNAQAAFSLYSPAGAVTAFAGQAAPAGWLECDGSAVNRTTYSNLFSVIGTTYGQGDTNTTFNLPELRGEFIRGWDHGRGVDTNPVARVFGSWQTNMIQSHTHDLAQTNLLIQNLSAGSNTNVYWGTGQTTGATGGNETRPRNVALLYIIKW